MTFWRVHSKARSTRVALEGAYQGSTGYLIGGSPRLLELDLRLLRMPGVWTMAINNAACVVEPDAFIALDVTSCFNNNIFSNPRIMKMMSYVRHDNEVSGRRACSYPNMFFFDLGDETEIYMSEFCRKTGPLPYWKNTFFTALAAMYQLGFETVYLLGCAFDQNYAADAKITEVERESNKRVYDDTVEKIRKLIPMVNDEGMQVYTCHEGTPIQDVTPYVPFEESISRVTTRATSVEFNIPAHVNEQHERQQYL